MPPLHTCVMCAWHSLIFYHDGQIIVAVNQLNTSYAGQGVGTMTWVHLHKTYYQIL
jgi:hypothetical protein